MKKLGGPLGAIDCGDLEHSIRALMQILRAEEVLYRVLIENAGSADTELASPIANGMCWEGQTSGESFRN